MGQAKLSLTHSLRPGPEELGFNVSGSDIWCLAFPSEQSAGEWLLKQTFTGDFIYATRRWCSLRNRQPTPSSSTCHRRPFRSQLVVAWKSGKISPNVFYYSIIAVTTAMGAAAASTYGLFNFTAWCQVPCSLEVGR